MNFPVLSTSETLRLACAFLAWSVALQCIEYWSIRSSFSDTGVWKWSIVKQEFRFRSKWTESCLSLLFSYRATLLWILLRLVFALGILGLAVTSIAASTPLLSVATGIFFWTTLLLAVRWRGSFNGGSDSMTLLVSGLLCVASAAATFGTPASWTCRTALMLIAVQTTASYFVAGIVKLKNPEWRDGSALPRFLREPAYAVPLPLRRALESSRLSALLASWFIMGIECAFPLVWLDLRLCAVGICALFGFHLFNAWALGLNRFTFAWLAAYPALYYAVGWVSTR